MKLAALALLAGCSRFYGLDPPELRADSSRGDDARADAAPDPSLCPSSYTLVDGQSRYRLSANKARWVVAALTCASDGPTGPTYTHLVVIGNDTERAFVHSLDGTSRWIGLSDRLSETQFRWNTNEPVNGYPSLTSVAWGANEPSGGPDENCVALNDTGSFIDASCDVEDPFVCECDGYADDAGRYTP